MMSDSKQQAGLLLCVACTTIFDDLWAVGNVYAEPTCPAQYVFHAGLSEFFSGSSLHKQTDLVELYTLHGSSRKGILFPESLSHFFLRRYYICAAAPHTW